MADGKTTGCARMDVGEVAPLRRAAAIRSGALQPRAAATRAYLGLARTYVPRNRALIVFDRYQTEGDGGRRQLKGGGGGSTPAAVARGRRWRTEGGGDPREAASRGRRWRPEMLSSPPAEDAGQMRSPSRVDETVTERKETERS